MNDKKPYRVLDFPDRIFSMRLFDDDVTRFPVGERLFERAGREYIPRGSWSDPPHYRIKNMYFESSDLNLHYMDEGGRKKIVAIRVALEENPKVGGSVSYADLGLVNRASVGAFVSKFDTIGLIGSIDGKLDYIAATILQVWRPALEDAMRREIVEETTADGAAAVWDLPLLYRRVAVERGDRDTVTFVFSSCSPVRKVREMDVFPMMYEGREVNAYFVYGDGRGKGRYLARLPYRDEGAEAEVEVEAEANAMNENIANSIAERSWPLAEQPLVERSRPLAEAQNWRIAERPLVERNRPLAQAQQPLANEIVQPEPEQLNRIPNVLAQTLLPGNEIEVNEENEMNYNYSEAMASKPKPMAAAPKPTAAAPKPKPRIKINYNYVPKKIQTRVKPRVARPPQTRRRFKPYRR